jgi:hypothetical protein
MRSMSLLRILNWYCYVVLAFAYLVSGVTLHVLCRPYSRVFAHALPGQPLPGITNSILSYGLSGASIWMGLLLAVGFLGLFVFLERGCEQRRAYVPICLTVAFIIVLVQDQTAFLAMTMPLIPIVNGDFRF